MTGASLYKTLEDVAGTYRPGIVPLADKLTWNANEAAEMCGLTVSTFYNWVRRGLMPRPITGTRKYSAAAVRMCASQYGGLGNQNIEADKPLDRWREERD